MHLLRAPYRLQTSQQYGGRLALRLGDKVQAAVHPVNQIDVRMARRAEHGGVAGCLMVAVGVGGLVYDAHIGLGFHNAAYQRLAVPHPHQVLPQQILGDGNRVTQIIITQKL